MTRTATTPPRDRDTRLAQLIVSVFASYARPERNWLSIAAVVSLMADLGFEAQAVRSAISRLKRRGVLLSERREGVAGYGLSAETLEVLAEGDVRIFERARATVEDGWVLAVFSVPESEREKRHEIRVGLTRLGFGSAAPGVWIAPATLVAEARNALDRRGLASYVDLFVAQYASADDLRSEVSNWWNLDDLSDLYAEFIERHRSASQLVNSGDVTPERAFQIYIPMLTQWRRLPYRDPGLPIPLLPPKWKGEAAAALFGELNAALRPLAHEHAMSVVHGQIAATDGRRASTRREA